jgi:NADPH:quinone reductase-like Zn-dependent oxidoreductase
MRAAQINEYGGIDVISITEVNMPDIQDNQVLVQVHASSINPVETLVHEGHIQTTLPATLGGDFAGVVTAKGADVDGFDIGDKVYGQASVLAGNSGAFAEFAATAAGQIARMPETVSFAEAASLPLVGVSALQALTQHITLQAGQKLFVHGGAGGIGSIAIQIAKNIGAYVATTATGDGIAFVQALGVDKVVDYKKQDFADDLSGYDAVFDLVGGDDYIKALGVLRAGGIGVSMTAHPDEAQVAAMGITSVSQLTHVTSEMLRKLAGLVDAKVVTAQIDTAFPLADIKKAFAARESGHAKGKVVVLIKA